MLQFICRSTHFLPTRKAIQTIMTTCLVMAAYLPAVGFSQQASNNTGNTPEISLILQGGFYKFDRLENRTIKGFMLPETELPERGFRLKESEFSISAAIDPSWSGNINIALEEGDANVEEAWIKTNALGNGFNLKAGRFLSGFGYLNARHSHDWDFSDIPLMYRVLFDGEQLSFDGVQLKWLAPTDLFVELGADVGRAGQFPSSELGGDKNGADAYTLFAHLGGDISENQSYRVGASFQRISPKQRSGAWVDQDNSETALNFSGVSKTYAIDFVWQLRRLGENQQASLKLQGELFQRQEEGDATCAKQEEESLCAADSTVESRLKYQGYYVQGIYQFDKSWRLGLRHEKVIPKESDFSMLNDVLAHPDYRAKQNSVMVDYAPSEFSRFRVQFNQNKTLENITENQVSLQYTVVIGKHAAHSF